MFGTQYADEHVVADNDLLIIGPNLWNLLGVQNEFDITVKEGRAAILSIIIDERCARGAGLPAGESLLCS